MSGYVGIPFVDGGRDRQGCDCWGLVRLVYADKGIQLPLYSEISAKELIRVARAMIDGAASEPWRLVERRPYRSLDVVVMRGRTSVSKVPWHVGVMLDAKRMLHTSEAAASHTIALDDLRLPYTVVSVHRHKVLA